MSNRRYRDILPLVTIFVVAFSTLAYGQLYQYTDKNGNVVFSDAPPAGTNAQEKHVKEDGIYWSAPRKEQEQGIRDVSAAAQPEAMPEKKLTRDFSNVTVVMYMTSWCGYCKKASAYVRSLGANLVQYDIEAQPERKAEMKTKSGGSGGVPLIDIGGIIIRGYSPEAIKAAVERVAAR